MLAFCYSGMADHESILLSVALGKISNGKPSCVFSRHGSVSSIYLSNELMRRCLLRRQSETSGEAFSRFWQHFRSVSFKGRFRRHLTSRCAVKGNSLALDISPFLRESVYAIRGFRKKGKETYGPSV